MLGCWKSHGEPYLKPCLNDDQPHLIKRNGSLESHPLHFSQSEKNSAKTLHPPLFSLSAKTYTSTLAHCKSNFKRNQEEILWCNLSRWVSSHQSSSYYVDHVMLELNTSTYGVFRHLIRLIDPKIGVLIINRT